MYSTLHTYSIFIGPCIHILCIQDHGSATDHTAFVVGFQVYGRYKYRVNYNPRCRKVYSTVYVCIYWRAPKIYRNVNALEYTYPFLCAALGLIWLQLHRGGGREPGGAIARRYIPLYCMYGSVPRLVCTYSMYPSLFFSEISASFFFPSNVAQVHTYIHTYIHTVYLYACTRRVFSGEGKAV